MSKFYWNILATCVLHTECSLYWLGWCLIETIALTDIRLIEKFRIHIIGLQLTLLYLIVPTTICDIKKRRSHTTRKVFFFHIFFFVKKLKSRCKVVFPCFVACQRFFSFSMAVHFVLVQCKQFIKHFIARIIL